MVFMRMLVLVSVMVFLMSKSVSSDAMCPWGWENSGFKCWWLSNSYKSWNDAKRDCSARGGALAGVRSNWDFGNLNRVISRRGRSHYTYWVGSNQLGSQCAKMVNGQLKSGSSCASKSYYICSRYPTGC